MYAHPPFLRAIVLIEDLILLHERCTGLFLRLSFFLSGSKDTRRCIGPIVKRGNMFGRNLCVPGRSLELSASDGNEMADAIG